MRDSPPSLPGPASFGDLERRWAVLRRQLDQSSPLLSRQGSIASRRSGSSQTWSVRYYETRDGRRIQRAILVGPDPALMRLVAAYLAELRAEAEWLQRMPRVCRKGRGLVRALSRRRKVS